MSELIPVLDHVVINVADQLDEASALFRRLGFQLSERGHHSLGSSNHLAVFNQNYLELLGWENDRGTLRQELWQSPRGLSGLVWKTDDADAVWQHLQQTDLAGDPPAAFFRPVTLPDGRQQEARFRTTRLRADRVPGGRSFFCQHLTPEAVWQPAWQQHANGVTDIDRFVIVADRPDDAATVYGQLFSAQRLQPISGGLRLQAGVAEIQFITPNQAQRDGVALPTHYDGSPRMTALGLKTRSREAVRTQLKRNDIAFRERDGEIEVGPLAGLETTLFFHQ